MNDLDTLRAEWTTATANLKHGEQKVFYDVLQLVDDEKKKDLVYGSDYSDNGACLVNAAGNLLATGGGSGIPMANFEEVVSLYDRINREFLNRDINTNNFVSPLAAHLLLQWFAPIKATPLETEINDVMGTTLFGEGVAYTEPTDEDMTRALLDMLSGEPSVIETPTTEPDFDELFTAVNDSQDQ